MTKTTRYWVIGTLVTMFAIWAIGLIIISQPSAYEKETRRFAAEIVEYERSCEHMQNLTMKNQIAYGSYAQGLRLMTREHLRRMGALRILQPGTDDYGKVSP